MIGGEDSAEQPLSPHEYEVAARAVLPPTAFAFVAGDGGREADERHRFALPPGLALANMRHPSGALRRKRTPDRGVPPTRGGQR